MKARAVSKISAKAAKPDHPLQWLAEPLMDDPSLVLKSWFGGRTIMLHGRHQLVLMTQGEPWQGVLVCTSHEHQTSLQAEIPSLIQHPVLGKWLYLAEQTDSFERDAKQLVQLVLAGDPRLGIEPSKRKKPRAGKSFRFGDPL